jgi:hypothetical protein
MLSLFVLRNYQMFRTEGYKAKEAIDYARALQVGFDRGWEVSWEDDEDADLSWIEDPDYVVEECLFAYLWEESGRILASLSGITNADRVYKKVIEAELIQQALEEEAAHAASFFYSSYNTTYPNLLTTGTERSIIRQRQKTPNTKG